MAGLQQRNGKYRVIFRYRGKQHSVNLGKVTPLEAEAKAGAIDLLGMRLKQGLIAVPAGVTIEEFMLSEGRAQSPPSAEEKKADEPVRLSEFIKKYMEARSGGSMEANSLATAKMHLRHVERTLGADFDMRLLCLADLQGHITKRRKEGDRRRKPARKKPISAATIRLEVSTLRSAWNWAVLSKFVSGPFPAKGLQYPKADEKPPFMTWDEVERRARADGAAEGLWDCLYLRKEEVEELLSYVKAAATAPWLYPMVAMAAYTGARRSELLRMEVADVDFDARTVLVREMKRSRKERTTRRVSLTPALSVVLKEWTASHPGGRFLFCQAGVVARSTKRGCTTGHRVGGKRETTEQGRRASVRKRVAQPVAAVTRDEAHDHLRRTLAGSKWEVLKGYHLLRHSFISCLAAAGVDQRIIDDFVGHCSEEQRRRYRHLVPDLKQKAIAGVFG